MVGVDPLLAQAGDGVNGDIGRGIGAVVEQLDLQTVTWPVEPARHGEGPLHDDGFVVDWDLDQNLRQLAVGRKRRDHISHRRQSGQPVQQIEVIGRERELHGEAERHDEVDG